MIYLHSDIPVSPPRTHHIHHELHDTLLSHRHLSNICFPERKFVKSSTLLRLKTRFWSQWNPGKFDPNFQETRFRCATTSQKKLSLLRPRGATSPVSVSVSVSCSHKTPLRKNLFSVSVSWTLTEKPIAEIFWLESTHTIMYFPARRSFCESLNKI